MWYLPNLIKQWEQTFHFDSMTQNFDKWDDFIMCWSETDREKWETGERICFIYHNLYRNLHSSGNLQRAFIWSRSTEHRLSSKLEPDNNLHQSEQWAYQQLLNPLSSFHPVSHMQLNSLRLAVANLALSSVGGSGQGHKEGCCVKKTVGRQQWLTAIISLLKLCRRNEAEGRSWGVARASSTLRYTHKREQFYAKQVSQLAGIEICTSAMHFNI